jgi:shikimate kinase
LSGQKIYLVGFMCSGKSTVGKIVARKLNWDFLDIDSLVQEREGMTIPEIFRLKGEEYFREAEKKVLFSTAGLRGCVLSTGGGLGANREAMEFMKREGFTVWLKVRFESFLTRCGSSEERPLLELGREELLNLMRERERVYSLADLVIEDEGGPEEKAEAIVRSYTLNLK